MSNTNPNSILQGNLCDVLRYFSGKECDSMDLLAQRALSIIFATSHLVHSGCDVNSEPVRANIMASAVLSEISEDDKHYPFVRAKRPAGAWTDSLSNDDLDFLFNKATGDLDIAEKLVPEGLIPEGLRPMPQGMIREPVSDDSAPQPVSGAFSGLVAIAEVEPLVFSVDAYAGASSPANSV